MSSQSSCTFKMEPAPVFLFAYITGCLLCSALVVTLAMTDPAYSGAKLPVVLDTIGYVLVFFGPPYAAIFALIMAHYFKYTVTAEGISGQSLLGKASFVAWTDIEEMRPIRVGNLQFVRLESRDGGPSMLLPLFARHASGVDAADIAWGPHADAAQALGLLIAAPARS